MKKKMYIMRGLPGSGKSTRVHTQIVRQHPDAVVASADNFFINAQGEYRYRYECLQDAHAWCQRVARDGARSGKTVVVDNTNTQVWEMMPYIKMAVEHGMHIEIVDVYDGDLSNEALAERNAHGVPLEVIARMRERWQMSPKIYD